VSAITRRSGSLDWTSPPCAPGDLVADKYRVERLLGSGGMAWVFEATHLVLGQRVALKFLRFDPYGDSAESIARFHREARLAATIRGEATTRVMDVGSLDDGAPFLVMECLDGHDLESVVSRRLSFATAVDYALQACEGVAETHAAGIVHRDLKPSNLFLARRHDGTTRVKLLDFGISKFVDAPEGAGVTRTQGLVGSPIYMSPEQMRTSRAVDLRTDIWSMGVILYELLGSGRAPFQGATVPEICARVIEARPAPLRSVRPDVPRGLEAAVARCLQKDPRRRFQTIAELARALAPYGSADAEERVQRIERILAAGTAPRPAPARRAALGPSWQVAAAAALVVAVAMTLAPGVRSSEVKTAAEVTARPAPEATEVAPAAAAVPARTPPEPSPALAEKAAPRTTTDRASSPVRPRAPAFAIAEFGDRE